MKAICTHPWDPGLDFETDVDFPPPCLIEIEPIEREVETCVSSARSYRLQPGWRFDERAVYVADRAS